MSLFKRDRTYRTHQEVLVLVLGVKQKSKQNQSHLSTTWLWFSFWFCLIINFYKCVSKLSYQNFVDLSTTSRFGSVSSHKEIRARARTQTELATEPEYVLKSSGSATRTRTSTEVLYLRPLETRRNY